MEFLEFCEIFEILSNWDTAFIADVIIRETQYETFEILQASETFAECCCTFIGDLIRSNAENKRS